MWGGSLRRRLSLWRFGGGSRSFQGSGFRVQGLGEERFVVWGLH
jgi:hypothetical protein